MEEGGKDAVSEVKVLQRFYTERRDAGQSAATHTLVEVTLHTGRTHQIRVHMTSINHPLLGDDVYGPKKCPFNLAGQMLHAGKLGFIHPSTKEYIEFNSELPEYFNKVLSRLE